MSRRYLILLSGILLFIIIFVLLVYLRLDFAKSDIQVASTLENQDVTLINQVQLSNGVLQHQSFDPKGSYEFTVDVTNNSDYAFSSLEMTIEVYDCPGDTIDTDCSHIGESSGFLFVDGSSYEDFPAHQTRDGLDFVSLNGMPAVKGNFLWTYSIDSVHQ